MRNVTAPDFPTLRGALQDEIALLRGEDALRPITVVCTSDVAREETRRELAIASGGTIGVTVVAWGGWIADLAGPLLAASGGRALPEPGFERLVAHLLEERIQTGPLAAAARAPGLARTVAASLADLIEGGFTPDALREWDDRDAVRGSLVRVFRAADAALREAGLFDRRRQEATAARAMAEAADSGGTGPPLVFFGFHDMTPRQRSVVLAASATRPVSLLVPGPGAPGGAAAEPLLTWWRDRGAETVEAGGDRGPDITLRQDGFREAAVADPGVDRLRLLTHACETDEVRGIARTVRHEVTAGRRAFDDFLITIPPDGPPPLLFRRVFAKADIPLADRAGIPATRTEPGRRAMALARALSARRDSGAREALDFLRAPEPPPGAEVEVDLFDDPFTGFTRARDWIETVRRFRELYAVRFGAGVSAEVDTALESIAAVHGRRPSRPRDFARAFGAALAGIRHRASAASRGEARVLLLRMDQARGVSRPVVFHAGLVEGALRRTPREDPLLPDALRESLNERFEHEGLHVRRREEARVERIALARFALETSTEHAVLSWARRRRTGAEERNPSGLFLDLAGARAGVPVDPTRPEFGVAAPTETREAARRAPIDRTDLDLALLAGPCPPGERELTRLLADDRAHRLPEALRATEGRWRPSVLTRFDGVLRNPAALREVRRRIAPERKPWSPTALESAANCPFAFLVERILRLRPPEDQEEDFDPLTRGLLFHEMLEILYTRLHRDDLLPLRPEHVGGCLLMLDDLVQRYRSAALREPPSRRAHRLATLAAMRDDAAVVLALDAHAPAGERARPVRFEYAFGMDDARNAPRIDLGDGRTLPVRGKADRVDRREDGRLDVIDVKTGVPQVPAGRISRTTGGKTTVHLQLPIYLEAVEQALGVPAARAVFYHATAEHGFERIPFTAEDLRAVRPRLQRLLRHVLERADAGWFPCIPGDACCRRSLALACGPASAARFLRKTSDPDLRERLRTLREPDRPEAGG